MADPMHCARCNQVHPRGCTGHRKGSDPLAPCRNAPIKGAPSCRMHGSSAGQVRRKAERSLIQQAAQQEVRRLGSAIEVTDAHAMRHMVHEAYGNVAYYRSLIQQLEQGGRLVGDPDPDDIVSAIAGEENPRPSIAGRVDPKNFKAEPHVLVAMYDAERERLVRWSKACRDAGVDEHLAKLATEQGEMLAQVLRVLLASLMAALTDAGAPEAVVRTVWQSEVPGIVRKALGEAGGEAA